MRLSRLARFVAEAVDEALELAPLGVCARLLRACGGQRLRMGFGEAREVAGVMGQAPARHVEDAVRHGIEQGAIVAHHHECPGIALQMSLQPRGRLEIEVVRRLVEQQQFRLEEEPSGERDPHAPAAGEVRERHLLHRLVDAEAGQQARSPRRGRVRADLRKPGFDLGAARTLGALRLGNQGRAFLVRCEHGGARRLRAARHLLVDQSHGKTPGAEDRAFIGLEPAHSKAQQGRLAAAIAPHQSEPLACADLRGHALEEEAPVDAVSDVLEGQHGWPDFCAVRAHDARPNRPAAPLRSGSESARLPHVRQWRRTQG